MILTITRKSSCSIILSACY